MSSRRLKEKVKRLTKERDFLLALAELKEPGIALLLKENGDLAEKLKSVRRAGETA